MDEEILSSVNAETVANVEPQQTEQPISTESVNVEVAEPLKEEKVVQTQEENAKFAEQRRAREAAESRANTLERNYSIAREYGAEWGVYSEGDIAEKYGHLGITTYDRFKEEVRKHKMQEQGLDPDTVNKYVEEHPDVKTAREWKQQQEAQKFIDSNRLNFLNWFESENGRAFDAKTDIIPEEVWQASELYEKTNGKEGKPLLDSYALYENKQLKAKQKAVETNKLNAESSTGSVTGNGNAKDTTLTPEMIEAMTDKERMSRWSEVKKVLGMK